MGRGRHRGTGTAPSGRVLGAVAAVAVILVAVAIAVVAGRGDRPQTEQLTRTTSAGPNPSASASPSTSTSPAQSLPPPTQRPVVVRPHTLVLTVTGSASYLEVHVHRGGLLLGNVYRHGQRFAFDQRALDVVIGDAGAVRLETNGKVRAPAGQPGQVLRFTVSRTG